MKKQVVLLAFLAAIVLFFSCKKNEESTGNNYNRYDTGSFEDSKPARTTESSASKQGYALRVNTGFYVLKDEDNGSSTTETKWDSSLTLGDSLLVGRPRRLTYEKKEYDFVEVRLDNKNKTQGFALANQIAVGGYLAVVIEEKANLFSEPKIGKVLNTVVSRKTVLAYFPETEKGGFVEVKGIDAESKNLIAEGRYMRLSSLSRNDSDIQASILLQTAEAMTNASQTVAKEAILKAALQDYPDSVFYNEIKKVANPNESLFDSDDY